MSFFAEIWSRVCHFSKLEPNRIALRDSQEVVSYAQFRERVLLGADQLLKLGTKPGQRVGLLMEPSASAYISLYASAYLGCTYIPLLNKDPPARLAKVLEDAELSVLVTDSFSHSLAVSAASLLSTPLQILEISQNNSLKDFSNPPDISLHEDTPLYLLFTSGSTGRPKGVPISMKNVESFCRWVCAYFRPNKDDVFLAQSRLTFDMSVFSLFAPIYVGASILIVDQPSDQIFPGRLLKDATIACFPPRVTFNMQEAGQMGPNMYPNLRHLIFGGELLLKKHLELWWPVNPHFSIHNLYGPTEATVACIFFTVPRSWNQVTVPIGIPTDGQSIYLLSEQNEEILGEGIGELKICGDQVSPYGYWKNKSDRFTQDRPPSFRTGDLAKRDSNGLYFWLGRMDDQVKVRGIRVELPEVEATLSGLPGVKDGICVLHKETETLVFVVSINENEIGEQVLDSLKMAAEEMLPAYMQPETYLIVDSIPQNFNGKIDRLKSSALVASYLDPK